jgi:hypothetical protein
MFYSKVNFKYYSKFFTYQIIFNPDYIGLCGLVDPIENLRIPLLE